MFIERKGKDIFSFHSLCGDKCCFHAHVILQKWHVEWGKGEESGEGRNLQGVLKILQALQNFQNALQIFPLAEAQSCYGVKENGEAPIGTSPWMVVGLKMVILLRLSNGLRSNHASC